MHEKKQSFVNKITSKGLQQKKNRCLPAEFRLIEIVSSTGDF